MQAAVRRVMVDVAHAELGHEGETSAIIEDFGLNHDYSDALDCWLALRHWHVLPCAGGWLDQPVAWRQDLQTLQAVYNEEIDVIQGNIPVVAAPPRIEETGAEIQLGIFDGT